MMDKVAVKINEDGTIADQKIRDAAFKSLTGRESFQPLLTDIEDEKRKTEAELNEARFKLAEAKSQLAEAESQLVEEQQKIEKVESLLVDHLKEMHEIKSQIQASVKTAFLRYQHLDMFAEKIKVEQCKLEDAGDGITTEQSVTGKELGLPTSLQGARSSGSYYIRAQQLQAADQTISKIAGLEDKQRQVEETRRECNEVRCKLAEVKSLLAEKQRKRKEMESRLMDRQQILHDEVDSQVKASIQAALSQYQRPTSGGDASSMSNQEKIAELEAKLHVANEVMTTPCSKGGDDRS